MKFQTPYTIDDKWSKQFETINNEPTMTQQADAMDTDINLIVKRFTTTGQLPQIQAQAMYEDFTAVTDYRNALDMVRAADEAFMEIPAAIRAEFNNNPQAFVNFATDPTNIEKMREWNLAPPKNVVQSNDPSKNGDEHAESNPDRHRREQHRSRSQDGPGTPGRPNDPGSQPPSPQGTDGRRGGHGGPNGPPATQQARPDPK